MRLLLTGLLVEFSTIAKMAVGSCEEAPKVRVGLSLPAAHPPPAPALPPEDLRRSSSATARLAQRSAPQRATWGQRASIVVQI